MTFIGRLGWLCCLLVVSSSTTQLGAMEWAEILQRIKETQPVFQLEKSRDEVYNLSSDLRKQPYSPEFYSQLGYELDRRQRLDEAVEGKQRTNRSVDLGIQQATAHGLSWAIGSRVQGQKRFGTNPRQYPTSEIFQTEVYVKAEAALWQNRSGRMDKLHDERILLGHQMGRLIDEPQKTFIIRRARQIFWDVIRLQSDQEVLRQLVKEAENLVGWAESRKKRHLGSDLELIEAKRFLANANLELNLTTQSLQAQRSNLSSFIGKDLTTQSLDGDLLALKPFEAEAPPSTASTKKDELELKIAEVGQEEAKEILKPSMNLQVFASTQALNEEPWQDSFEELGNRNDQPNYEVRLELTWPLYGGLDRLSLRKQSLHRGIARQKLDQNKQNRTRLWQQLSRDLNLLVLQTKQVEELVEIKDKRLEAVHARHKLGKTTLAQVIEYADSKFRTELRRNRLALQALTTKAHLEFFDEGP